MSSTIPNPALGSIVQVSIGGGVVARGTVKFCGLTEFKPGTWVGVELDEAIGKNDGSVEGVQYFTCRGGMGYGVFVRASQIKAVLGSEVVKLPEKPGATRAGRPTLGHQRTNSLSRASPASGSTSASSRAASPAKSVTAAAPAVKQRLGPPSPTKRPSIGHQPRRSVSLKQPPSPQPRVSSPLTLAPSPLRSSPLAQPPTPPPPSAPAVVDDTELVNLRTQLRLLETKRLDDQRQITLLESRFSEAQSFVALRPKLQAKLQSQQTELISVRRELADTAQLVQLAEGRVHDAHEQLEMVMLDKEMAEERAEMAEGELEDLKERLAIAEVELEVLREEAEAVETSIESAVPGKDTSLAYIQLEKQNERLKEALLRLRDVSLETDTDQRRRITEMERDLAGLDELRAEHDNTVSQLNNASVQIQDLKLQLDDALGAEDMLVQLTERNLMLGEKIEEMRITIQDLEALKDLSDELEENHIESEKALQSDISLLTSQLYTKSQTIETLTTSLSDAHSTLLQFRSLVIELQGEINEMRSQTQEAQSESQNAIGQQKLMAAVNMRLQSTAERNQGREVEMLVGRLELGLVKEELAVVEGYLPEVWSHPDHINDSDGEAGGGLGVGDKDSLKCVLYFQRMAGKADIINEVVAKMHSLPEALDSPNSSSPITELLVGVCELRGRLSSLSTLCKRFASVLRRASPEWYLELGRALWVREDVGSLEKRMDLHVALLRGSGEPGKGEFRERECVQDVARLQAQFNHLAEVYLSPLAPQSSSSINGSGSTSNQHQANSNTGGVGAGVSYNPLYDIAERELGSVELFDLDLDMFAASIGMMKTSVEGIVGSDSEEYEADFGGFDINTELYEPLQKILDKSKSAKSGAKKMSQRLISLSSSSQSTPSSSPAVALKPHLIPHLESLNNTLQELLNFGIGLAQQTLGHLREVRGESNDNDGDANGTGTGTGKTPFSLRLILSFAKQQAALISGAGERPGTLWWESVGERIAGVVKDAGKLLEMMSEGENVLKITFTPPWIPRIPILKSLLPVNLEASLKITSLTSDLSSALHTLKSQNQSLAESQHKISLLEHRNAKSTQQAELAAKKEEELEGELAKMKKSERKWEEIVEALNGEMEVLERENGQLKSGVGVGTSVGAGGVGVSTNVGPTGAAEHETSQTVESNLDHAQLLDQYTSLRNTLRFLRMENSYLKGQDLLRDIQALPPIPQSRSRLARTPTPPLDPSGLSDTDDEDNDMEDEEEGSETNSNSSQKVRVKAKPKPNDQVKDIIASSSLPTGLSLAAETKLLYRSVIKFSSSPRVVNLSEVNERRLEASRRVQQREKQGQGGKGSENQSQAQNGEAARDEDEGARAGGVWMPRRKMPAQYVLDRKMERERLARRVKGLVERVNAVGV